MKALRYLLYALGGLAGLGLVALAAVLVIVDGGFVKAKLVEAMKQRNRTLTIEGEPKLSLFPVFSLELGKTTLTERASDRPFVSLESAKLALRVLPLVSGDLAVEALAVSGLDMRLVKGRDGRFNFDDLAGRPGEAAKDAPGAGPDRRRARSLRIAEIRIENAKFAYRDEASGREVSLPDFDFVTGRLAADAPSPVRLVATVKGRRPALDLKLDLAGNLRLDPARGIVEVAGLVFNAKGMVERDSLAVALAAPQLSVSRAKAAGQTVNGSLVLKGPGRNLSAKLAIAAVEGSAASLSIPEAKLEFDSQLEDRGARGTVSTPVRGNLATRVWELPKIAADLTFSGPAIPQKSVTLPIRAAARADLAKRNATLELASKFDETTLQAKLGATRFEPLVASFDLAIDRLNLDRYLREAPAGKQPADDRVDLSVLRGRTVNGRIAVGALQARNVKLTDIKAELRLAGGRLEVAPYSARLYEGTVSGSILAEADGNRVALKDTLTGVQIGPLLRDAAKKNLLEGKGNVTLDIATAGPTVSAMKKALAGSARLELKDGAIRGINLAENLRNVRAALGSRSAQQASDTGKKTDFSEMSASFRIDKGVARNDDLQAQSPFIRLGGGGAIDIGGNSIDYLARVSLVATSQGQGGRAAGDLAGITVPVKLSGPLDRPNWNIDYSGLLGSAAGGAAGAAGEAASGAAKGVRDAVKGLFGR